MFKRLLMSIAGIFLLYGCVNTPGSVHPNRPIDRETEENAISSAIMNAASKDLFAGHYQLIVQMETEIGKIDDSPYLKKELTPVSAEVIDDYKNINAEPYQLDTRFKIDLPYTLVSEREITAILSENYDQWDGFYNRFPDAPGYYILSRVGFSHNGDQALVYMGYLCQVTCGNGHLFFLAKENGLWEIQKQILLWQS